MQQPNSNQQLPLNFKSGIVFGPGRSTRLPEKGTPEYEQIIARMLDNLTQAR